MGVAELLDRLLEADVKVSVKEDKLLLIPASDEIRNELKEEVRANKALLLEYLKKIQHSRKNSTLSDILIRNTLKEDLCYRQQNWWRAVRVGRGFSPVGTGFFLEGEYQQDSLIDSFRDLAERHKILKATLSIQGDTLYQEISDKPLNMEFYDLSHLDEQEAKLETSRISVRMSGFPHIPAEQSLGITDQTLVSAACANLGNNKIFICIYIDHIISDGYSIKILTDEFREIYRAKMELGNPDLSPLPFQYLDYVAWSNRLNAQDSIHLKKLHAFWKRHCEKLTVTRLSHEYGHSGKESNGYQSEHIRFGVAHILSKEFLSICRAKKYPIFSALITIFFVTVSRFMRQSNPTIATILSGRDKAGTENLAGSFAEMVYARLDIPEETPYGDLVTKCNHILNEIHENLFIDWTIYLRKEISASYIAKDEKAGPDRKSSGPSTGFAFSIEPGLNLSEEWMALYTEDCTYFRREASYISTNFIWFRILGYDEKILCDVQYETRHFSRDKIRDFIYLFKSLLEDFCAKQKHS